MIKYKIGLWATIITVIALYPVQVFSAPQPLKSWLEDGVVLRVHLREDLGIEGDDYAQEVLQAAAEAYQEVIARQGFNREGYTFATASRLFAYDSDRTIDIYIANVEAPFALMQPQGGLEYKAEIFVPADYKGYRKRYKIDHPHLELKASLTHELLHIITYSYNRNMQTTAQGKAAITSGPGPWDWYTEGLARYFETLAGYREEFLSSGFRKRNGKVIMVYKGGVNYFLKYPDKPLNERKYDFALFWQYLHQNYGMDKIEEISFKFRQIDPQLYSNLQAMQIIAQTLEIELDSLWQDFSLYVYEVSSLPDKREEGINPVSILKLSLNNRGKLYDISSFGFDFYEIDLRKGVQSIQLTAVNGEQDLNCLIGVYSPSNFMAFPIEVGDSGKIKIDARDFPQNSKMLLMLSNPTDQTISYRISLN